MCVSGMRYRHGGCRIEIERCRIEIESTLHRVHEIVNKSFSVRDCNFVFMCVCLYMKQFCNFLHMYEYVTTNEPRTRHICISGKCTHIHTVTRKSNIYNVQCCSSRRRRGCSGSTGGNTRTKSVAACMYCAHSGYVTSWEQRPNTSKDCVHLSI